MRVRLVADMLEERWPSMDLFADMLAEYLPQTSPPIDVELFRLPLRRRMKNLSSARATSIDRLMARHFDYPRELRRRGATADIDHIVDHTYAASARFLGPGPTVITCHDLDAFSPLRERRKGLRDGILATLAKRTLEGLKLAAHVVCDAETVRAQLVSRGWVQADRTTVIPAGVHLSFSDTPDPIADARIDALLGPLHASEILHVGSTIPRKRIDTLLEAFARVRKVRPGARLLRAGGSFTEAQRRIVSRLALTDAVTILPFLTRPELAALYRRATLVVLPSESEGFGLPLIEAMGCGTPVLASDLPVFLEVAGDATAYARVGDPHEWARGVLALLDEREGSPANWSDRMSRGLIRAKRYSWLEHARRLSEVYATLLGG